MPAAAETAPFGKTDPEQFRRLFELNVLGIVNCAQILLPGMVARKSGRIVAVASTAGLKGYGYVSAYVTSKHAVVGLVRSLAIETARSGVTVNAVCPSFTDTDLVRESVAAITKKTGRSEQDVVAQYVKDVPMARLIKPEEVAAAVVYLCSAEASAVTGTAMTVAGGRDLNERRRDAPARCRNQSGRTACGSRGRVASVAASSHLHDADRERNPPAPARPNSM